MIRPPHPMALPISLLLWAERKQHTLFEIAVYEVLNSYMGLKGWPDEMRSDLYARIAERVTMAHNLIDTERIINECLWQTLEEFGG